MLIREPKRKAEHLEAMTATILEAALRRRPLRVPFGFRNAIEAAMDHEMPTLKEWFAHEVAAIISGKLNDNKKSRWHTLEALQIMTAALRQLSISEMRFRLLWEQALSIPQYSTTAMQAFTVDASELALHLETWWKTRSEGRDRDLRLFVEDLVKLVPEKETRIMLIKHKGASWSPELRMAMNVRLESMGLEPVFPPLIPAVN